MPDAGYMADLQDVMGYQGLVGPNKYLQYQGQIPMAGFYTGQNGNLPPTDAMGNPIQSFTDTQKLHDAWDAAHPAQPPGTTLNSTPNAQWAINNEAARQMMNTNAGTADQMFQANNRAYGVPQQGMGGYEASRIYAINKANQAYANATGQPYTPVPGQPGSGGSAAGGAAATNPYDMRQAYLTALSNPGKVNTPGAQIYPGAAQTGAPQPSVLQKFLANNQASTGGGGYSNQPFFQTLNALKQGSPT